MQREPLKAYALLLIRNLRAFIHKRANRGGDVSMTTQHEAREPAGVLKYVKGPLAIVAKSVAHIRHDLLTFRELLISPRLSESDLFTFDHSGVTCEKSGFLKRGT